MRHYFQDIQYNLKGVWGGIIGQPGATLNSEQSQCICLLQSVTKATAYIYCKSRNLPIQMYVITIQICGIFCCTQYVFEPTLRGENETESGAAQKLQLWIQITLSSMRPTSSFKPSYRKIFRYFIPENSYLLPTFSRGMLIFFIHPIRALWTPIKQ